MPSPPKPASSPLSPDDARVLRDVAALLKGLARAAAIGRTNALGYLLFGAITFLFAAPGLDWLHLAEGALVATIGWLQRSEAPRLARGEPAAARAMSKNELSLMTGLVIYCLARLFLLEPEGLGQPLDPRLAKASGVDLEGMTAAAHTLIFGTMLVVAFVYQGGLALYFHRRIPVAEQYQREAPEWARETLGSISP